MVFPITKLKALIQTVFHTQTLIQNVFPMYQNHQKCSYGGRGHIDNIVAQFPLVEQAYNQSNSEKK